MSNVEENNRNIDKKIMKDITDDNQNKKDSNRDRDYQIKIGDDKMDYKKEHAYDINKNDEKSPNDAKNEHPKVKESPKIIEMVNTPRPRLSVSQAKKDIRNIKIMAKTNSFCTNEIRTAKYNM